MSDATTKTPLNPKIINAEQAPKPVGLYPHARQVGDLLFLSGVGPRKAGTKEIPGVELDEQGKIKSYDIEAQCHSVFTNIRLILEASNASWMDLVDVTVFLTNMDDDFAAYNRIYAEYFADNQPCRTTVEINKLPTPIAIELKCIAALNQKTKPNSKATEE
jgi:2-aminomuconate deaminase